MSASGIASASHIVSGLTQGQLYEFKVEAQNAFGFSFFGNKIQVLAAQVPAQPDAPVTTWVADSADPTTENLSSVVISWVAPDNGGSPLIGYNVQILQQDGAYSVDLTNCDMSSSTLLSCTIPVQNLLASPYSLTWADSVSAQVSAANIYGYSELSAAGNGAVLVTNPDVPQVLAEDVSQRTKSTLALTWEAPTFTGGTFILDYRV